MTPHRFAPGARVRVWHDGPHDGKVGTIESIAERASRPAYYVRLDGEKVRPWFFYDGELTGHDQCDR